MSTGITKIYENSNLTVEARIDKREVASIEEITFKFLTDGEQFEEQTILMSHAKTVGNHARRIMRVQSGAVPGLSCYSDAAIRHHRRGCFNGAQARDQRHRQFPGGLRCARERHSPPIRE